MLEDGLGPQWCPFTFFSEEGSPIKINYREIQKQGVQTLILASNLSTGGPSGEREEPKSPKT